MTKEFILDNFEFDKAVNLSNLIIREFANSNFVTAVHLVNSILDAIKVADKVNEERHYLTPFSFVHGVWAATVQEGKIIEINFCGNFSLKQS
jgi:hypothetical protein